MNTQVRELTLEEVEIEITADYDDIPVRGNAMASDDLEYDRSVEDKIISRLNSGDVWAWANVCVTARWEGFTGRDYLGACSYADESDFKIGGHFEDMCAEALDDLNRQIADTAGQIDQLR